MFNDQRCDVGSVFRSDDFLSLVGLGHKKDQTHHEHHDRTPLNQEHRQEGDEHQPSKSSRARFLHLGIPLGAEVLQPLLDFGACLQGLGLIVQGRTIG